MVRFPAWILLVSLGGCASVPRDQAVPAGAARPRFEFHSRPWINLHHVLYGAALARHPDPLPAWQQQGLDALASVDAATLPPEERAVWDTAVETYAVQVVGRDFTFDDAMIELKNQLGPLGDAAELQGGGWLSPEVGGALRQAMPIYRARWWPEHDRSNRAWRDARLADLARAPELAGRLADLYGTTWPQQPLTVDLTAYANWGGGYTTLNPTAHLTISSRDARNQGLAGLEILLHEGSHAFIRPLRNGLDAELGAQNKRADDLWHALLFYTTGELIALHSPGYVTVADREGLYKNAWKTYREVLAAHWRPYLLGEVGRAEALRALVSALPLELPPANAMSVWLQPFTGDQPLAWAVTAMTSHAADLEEQRASLLSLQERRSQVAGALRIMEEGLAAEACAVEPNHQVFGLLSRARDAMDAIVLAAYEDKPVAASAKIMLEVGGRLARCDQGQLLSFWAGQTIFGDAQDLTLWLAGHGLLTPADVSDIVARMARHRPGFEQLRAAVLNETENTIDEAFAPLAAVEYPVFAPAATAQRLREEAQHLLSVAQENKPGWVERWEARRAAFLSDADLALMASWDKAMQSGAAADMAQFVKTANEVPPNVVGRFILWRGPIPGGHVETALEGIRRAAMRTDVLQRGAWVRTHAKLELPKPEPEAQPPSDLDVCKPAGEGTYVVSPAIARLYFEQGFDRTSAKLMPAHRDGRGYGLQIFSFAPHGFFSTCKRFRNGDVILEVNGIVPDSPKSVEAIAASVGVQRRAAIRLQRGDEVVRFVIAVSPSE